MAADLQRRVLDPGVEGIIVNLVPNGHEPGVVTMVGEMLGKLLRDRVAALPDGERGKDQGAFADAGDPIRGKALPA